MHHTLRYGKHNLLQVIVYGDITEQEKETFTYMAERNAINDGFIEGNQSEPLLRVFQNFCERSNLE